MTSRQVDSNRVRSQYNSRPVIWAAEDLWHSHTHSCIHEAADRLTRPLTLSSKRILNLGSGGNSYGIASHCHVQLDLAERLLPRGGLSIVGNVEALPLASSSFDFILCVGAVLNYSDGVAAVSEIARVLSPGGMLLLEFESSKSGEYIGRAEFGKAGALVTTTFQSGPEQLWLYNPSYIAGLLRAVGMQLVHDEGFHTFTALAFRIFQSETQAMNFARIDRLPLARWLLRGLACNRIFLAHKGL